MFGLGKQREEIERLRQKLAKAQAQRDKARSERDSLELKLAQVRQDRGRIRQKLDEQWEEKLRGYHFISPPEHLQIRVAGNCGAVFVRAGSTVAQDLESALARDGFTWAAGAAVLDFGCGCGRVAQFLKGDHPEISLGGTDIDAEAIAWCREALSEVGEFSVNGFDPPLSYADAAFDLVFCISIFTHLPEAMQFAWLAELQRIIKPGGTFLTSIHGPTFYPKIPKEQVAAFEQSGFCYLETGATDGLPEFYQTAFHQHDYIRDRWAEYFEIREIVANGINQNQDLVICRRRS